jgi:tetratricopeptide (TPR) repeat protein
MSRVLRQARQRWSLLGVLILPLSIVSLLLLPPAEARRVIDEAVARAYNRGLGHLEERNLDEAVAAFEEVRRLAPGWAPGEVNLALALAEGAEFRALTDELAKRWAGWRRRAIMLFEDVIDRRSSTPTARALAHYRLGELLLDTNRRSEAAIHLEQAAHLNPHEPATWLRLNNALSDVDSRRAADAIDRALACNPLLFEALWAYRFNEYNREHRPDACRKALEKLRSVGAKRLPSLRDSWTGRERYPAPVELAPTLAPDGVGPLPAFGPCVALRVELSPGTRWASPADFGTDQSAELRRRLRARFGTVLITLDYDGDGLPDLFLAGAIIRRGAVGNLLLRNLGGRFVDVTETAGLAGPHLSLGCTVADFDNDGHPDLLVTGIGSPRLFRNRGNGTFEEVTVGFGGLDGVFLGAAAVDLDQDGLLDIVLAQYAGSPQKHRFEEGIVVLRNSTPRKGNDLDAGHPPICFSRLDFPGFRRMGPVTGLAFSALASDGVSYLLVLADRRTPALLVNNGRGGFERRPLSAMGNHRRWNGALVIDVHQDQKSDLVLLSERGRPVLLHQTGRRSASPQDSFRVVELKCPPLRQAQMIDLDLDGWPDLVGVSHDGRAMLLHNRGGGLSCVGDAAVGSDWPQDLEALLAVDFNGDGLPDLVGWSARSGLVGAVNRGNGNHGLRLRLRGRSPGCTRDGFGTRVAAHSAFHRTVQEYATLSAGLGQSLQPLLLGLGRHHRADLVRLRWLGTRRKAVLDLVAGQVHEVEDARPGW